MECAILGNQLGPIATMIQDSELLRPSLTPGRTSPAAIYSAQVGFLASFFGGPVAGAQLALLNSHRLGRLSADWPAAVLALALTVGLHWSIALHAWDWLGGPLGKSSAEYLLRLAGIAFFGLLYLRHRPYYRSMSLLGLKARSGVGAGLAAVVTGLIVEAALTALMPE